MGAPASRSGSRPSGGAAKASPAKPSIPSAWFTPGPWSILNDEGLKVTAPDGDAEPWHVAHICGACGHEVDASEANARLIAAAPELYEALSDLVETLRREAPGTALNNHRFDALGIKANNALNKAHGQ